MPLNATTKTHPHISVDQLPDLFIKHAILLKRKRQTCNKLDINHVHSNDGELASNFSTRRIGLEKLSLNVKSLKIINSHANDTHQK